MGRDLTLQLTLPVPDHVRLPFRGSLHRANGNAIGSGAKVEVDHPGPSIFPMFLPFPQLWGKGGTEHQAYILAPVNSMNESLKCA